MQKPRHALDQAGAEVVERDGDSHRFVGHIRIAVAKEHDLIMVEEVVIGDGNKRGGMDDIDEAIGAGSERIVVDPNVA